MPVVTFDYNDFLKIFGYEIPKEDLIKRLPMIGADFDKIEDAFGSDSANCVEAEE